MARDEELPKLDGVSTKLIHGGNVIGDIFILQLQYFSLCANLSGSHFCHLSVTSLSIPVSLCVSYFSAVMVLTQMQC